MTTKIHGNLSEEQVLIHKINKALVEAKLDHSKKNFQTSDIAKVANKLGYSLSHFQAIEANLVAKGGYKANGAEDFSIEDLAKWFLINIPFLRPAKSSMPLRTAS